MTDAEDWKVRLPSWRDGSARRSVLAFLQEIIQGPHALPPADRVAAFDNDGTLACEKPHTALAGFLLDRAAAAGTAAPSMASGQDVLRDLGVLFAGQTTQPGFIRRGLPGRPYQDRPAGPWPPS